MYIEVLQSWAMVENRPIVKQCNLFLNTLLYYECMVLDSMLSQIINKKTGEKLL